VAYLPCPDSGSDSTKDVSSGSPEVSFPLDAAPVDASTAKGDVGVPGTEPGPAKHGGGGCGFAASSDTSGVMLAIGAWLVLRRRRK